MAVKPLPCEVHEHYYAESVRILGLTDLSAEKRLSHLQDLDPDDLAKISCFPSRPIVDHDICLAMPSIQAIENEIPLSLHRGWCQDLFMGDCQFDVREELSTPFNNRSYFTSRDRFFQALWTTGKWE